MHTASNVDPNGPGDGIGRDCILRQPATKRYGGNNCNEDICHELDNRNSDIVIRYNAEHNQSYGRHLPQVYNRTHLLGLQLSNLDFHHRYGPYHIRYKPHCAFRLIGSGLASYRIVGPSFYG